ncbi:aspartic peptidase domain-containing protein [Pisolithus marmoratus]|nr:aspartic peptidase domain-containing protein [Pisolithus marmoratus]
MNTSITQGIRIPLRNVDVAYLLRLDIGDHEFWVVFDTGSADLWVVSTDCNTADCQDVPKYSQAESHTLSLSGEPFKLNYLSGSVVGTVGTETIELGSYQIVSQTFALANQTTGLDLAGMGNSGILGLAFPSIAAIQPTLGTTVLENVFDHLSDEHRLFAYTLGRNNVETGTSSDSSVTIGTLDSSIVNDSNQLSFFPVFRTSHSPYDFWKLPIQSITINSLSLPLSRSLVPGAISPIGVLDTGTTFILGPAVDVEAFWNTVNVGNSVRFNKDSQRWEVRCDRAVDVRVKLGEEGNALEIPLHPEDVNVSWDSVDGDSWCTGGLQANDGVNSGDWILGDSFLRNAYVVHQAASSTRPALIGLLNMTDPQTALLDFQKARGQDPLPISSVSGQLSRPQTRVVGIAVAVCVVGGLVIGVIAAVFYGSRRRSQRMVEQNSTV